MADGDAFSVGLACGGKIEISLFVLSTAEYAVIAACCAALNNRYAGALLLSYRGENAQFSHDGCTELTQAPDQLALPITPPYRMKIIGAVHIAQYLAPMATQCGYDVSVIDPRGSFTEGRTFDGAQVIPDWPDEHFTKTPPDETTAVVTLTHDPKLDDAALKPALESEAFYIGCLGSKKTHAARLGRLANAGIQASDLTRIHGPVGLNIGAKTPAEIAVSILAEVTAARRGALS